MRSIAKFFRYLRVVYKSTSLVNVIFAHLMSGVGCGMLGVIITLILFGSLQYLWIFVLLGQCVAVACLNSDYRISLEDSLREMATLGDIRGVLKSYISVSSGFSHAALRSKAEEILLSLPNMAREYRLLKTAQETTTSDLKKQMYLGEMEMIQYRVGEIVEYFAEETLRLQKSLPAPVVDEYSIEVPNLPAVAMLELHLDDVRAIAAGLEEGDGLTLIGADPLAREIDELSSYNVLQFPSQSRAIGE